MLKQCLINGNYRQLQEQTQMRPPKCGEIFYEQEANSFQLICCLCNMKHFEFEDFQRHIRNVHFDRQGKPLTYTMTALAETGESKKQKQEPLSLEEEVMQYDAHQEPDDDYGQENNDDDDDDEDDVKPLRVLALSLSKSLEEQPISEPEIDHDEDDEEEYNDDDDDDVDYEEEKPSVFKRPQQSKDFNCEHCSRKYTTQKYLNIHLKMSHPHPKAFKCSDCDAIFDVDRALDSHRRKMHTEFSCKLCNKIFKSSRTLLRHVQGHSGVRQFKCDFENCEKSFVNQHNLTSHRRVHSMERNYICELCGYRSRYRDALVVHRRSHTGEKPFKCQSCDRAFASRSLLNEHQAMHSTERPYKCDKCEASFSRPKALYHHKHLHLGIKKFKCKICGNAYAQAAGLSAHMRGHKLQAGASTGPSLSSGHGLTSDPLRNINIPLQRVL
ncbi:uncharacterized protein Dwil_GK19959 [Drosophila willistoni]|uniref:C2H2-type domain-containing protein n=1 Tax=Drosophila willistoni TaxID=7260 RepID=B4MSE7_DROWI|nr:zinc finger protein 429 [Drosophila willistoni]EDW75036.1 uncharacterized protein Dwil_GK19959 [Drosophila willistoni]